MHRLPRPSPSNLRSTKWSHIKEHQRITYLSSLFDLSSFSLCLSSCLFLYRANGVLVNSLLFASAGNDRLNPPYPIPQGSSISFLSFLSFLPLQHGRLFYILLLGILLLGFVVCYGPGFRVLKDSNCARGKPAEREGVTRRSRRWPLAVPAFPAVRT